MAVGQKQRFTIFRRDGFTCHYCGRDAKEVQLEVDHMVPVSKGGTDDSSNLVTACYDCNRGKRHHPGNIDYWRDPLQEYYERDDVRASRWLFFLK